MTGTKTKRLVVFGLFVLLIAVAIGFVYAANMALSPTEDDGKDPGSTDDTTIYGGTSGSNAQVWQSLYIKNRDGTSYWANAPQRFNPAAIFGSPDNVNYQEISSIQNNIYMRIADSGVTSWTFSCKETIQLTDSNGDLVTTIANDKTVTASGQSVPSNENVWVTGASITSGDLETLLNQPAGNYHIVISMRDINLQLTANGQAKSLSTVSGAEQNVLSWAIKIQ